MNLHHVTAKIFRDTTTNFIGIETVRLFIENNLEKTFHFSLVIKGFLKLLIPQVSMVKLFTFFCCTLFTFPNIRPGLYNGTRFRPNFRRTTLNTSSKLSYDCFCDTHLTESFLIPIGSSQIETTDPWDKPMVSSNLRTLNPWSANNISCLFPTFSGAATLTGHPARLASIKLLQPQQNLDNNMFFNEFDDTGFHSIYFSYPWHESCFCPQIIILYDNFFSFWTKSRGYQLPMAVKHNLKYTACSQFNIIMSSD